MNSALLTRRCALKRVRIMRRQGTTLIETIVVVSMVSVILGAIGTVLHGVWRAELAARRHGTSMSAMAAVADQFRRDTHAGHVDGSAVAASGAQLDRLVIVLPGDQTVEYCALPGRITRELHSGENVTHSEEYILPRGATAAWRMHEERERLFVSLLIDGPLDAKQPDFSERRTLRVDAVRGLDAARLASRQP